jgi:hypothetical protein
MFLNLLCVTHFRPFIIVFCDRFTPNPIRNCLGQQERTFDNGIKFRRWPDSAPLNLTAETTLAAINMAPTDLDSRLISLAHEGSASAPRE